MSEERRALLGEVLAERLTELRRARDALQLSYRRVGGPDMIDVLSRGDDGLIEIEAFTARFARVIDILVQQVLRSADEREGLEPVGPLDRIERAEKRGWAAAAADLIDAGGLRNRIAHEYDAEGWRQIARLAYGFVPPLLLCVERVLAGAQPLAARRP